MAAEHLGIRQDKPQPARIYDHFLGGKDHYAVDRIAAQQLEHAVPTARLIARTNRNFMHRATRYLAECAGVRQFLDIGTGIPTEPNLHQVAQQSAPEARVVYVDNDPIVLAHARALMIGTPEGRTTYIPADVTEPETILAAPQLRETLDLSRPVALSLIALLHFVPGDPYAIVGTLLDALAPGSYLALTHVTADYHPRAMAEAVEILASGGNILVPRSQAECTRFFDGLELVEPGITGPHRWHFEGITPPESLDAKVSLYAGVGRKPR